MQICLSTARMKILRVPSPLGSFVLTFHNYIHLPPSPPPLILATTNLFFISKMLLFQEFYINGIIQHITFGNGLAWFRIMPWRFLQFVECINTSFLFIVWYGRTTACLTLYALKDIFALSRFWLTRMKVLWMFMYRYLCDYFISLGEMSKSAVSGLPGNFILTTF